MEPLRKPLQGVGNIIRFNWHFYVFSIIAIVGLYLLRYLLGEAYQILPVIMMWLIAFSTLISLAVSMYVYDLSGLYKLNWLNNLPVNAALKLVNINAGFDETSALLQHKYPAASLIVYDFYDPLKHTEVSIKRARQAYPPFKGTVTITTNAIPLPDNYADVILLIFAAHEIRSNEERNQFFIQLNRVLKPGGKLVLMEHLRDWPNFMAYNIGFLHFMSRTAWLNTFNASGFSIDQEIKFTPFITNFVLVKNGDTN
jgi:SAM-dependent methyltransferase